MTPMSGTARSSRVRLVRRTAIATTAAVMIQNTIETGTVRNRSAACISGGMSPGGTRAVAIENSRSMGRLRWGERPVP